MQLSEPEESALKRYLSDIYVKLISFVIGYIAFGFNLKGLLSETLANCLSTEATSKLDQARKVASRLSTVGAAVPAWLPPGSIWDDPECVGELSLLPLINGITKRQTALIALYKQIIDFTNGKDPVSQALLIQLQSEEEALHTKLKGFAKELTVAQAKLPWVTSVPASGSGLHCTD